MVEGLCANGEVCIFFNKKALNPDETWTIMVGSRSNEINIFDVGAVYHETASTFEEAFENIIEEMLLDIKGFVPANAYN